MTFYDHAQKLSVHAVHCVCVSNPFQGDINDIATIISSVFQENANQLECEIINLQTYL